MLLGIMLSSWSALFHMPQLEGALPSSRNKADTWIQSIKPTDFGDFVCTHEAKFKHHSEQILSLSSHTVSTIIQLS